jgi:hypothetical protein
MHQKNTFRITCQSVSLLFCPRVLFLKTLKRFLGNSLLGNALSDNMNPSSISVQYDVHYGPHAKFGL